MKPTLLRRWSPIGVLSACLLFPFARVAAQDTPAARIAASEATALLNAVRPALVRALAANPGSPATDLTDPTSTRFVSTGHPLIAGDMLEALAGNPDFAAQLRPLVDQATTAFEAQAKASGLDHDVAAALALTAAAADLGYRGREMSGSESDAVTRQLRRALDTPEMRAATDHQKQELYEFCTTFGLYLLLTRQAAVESGGDSLGRLKPVAGGALAWVFGVPADSVTIDEAGLHVDGRASTVSRSPANPAPAANVSLVGTWNSFGTDSNFTMTTNAAGTGASSYGIVDSLRVRFIAFLPGGWFTTAVWRDTSFVGVDPAVASRKEPNFWGRYTFDGQHGVINFISGSSSTIDLVNGKLRYARQEYSGPAPLK
jgi:hypothetical protein